jgi:hypothetical protein
VTSWTSSAFSQPLRAVLVRSASSLGTRDHRTDRHLTATRVANERCAYVMRGVGGVAIRESSHWSISHSLISHHRTATIKQSTGLVGSLWSACVAAGSSRCKIHYTSFISHYIFKLTTGKTKPCEVRIQVNYRIPRVSIAVGILQVIEGWFINTYILAVIIIIIASNRPCLSCAFYSAA